MNFKCLCLLVQDAIFLLINTYGEGVISTLRIWSNKYIEQVTNYHYEQHEIYGLQEVNK